MYLCRIRTIKLSIIILLSLIFGYASILTAQEVSQTPAIQYSSFERWGMKFEYPKDWQEHPQDRVEMMKSFIREQLESDNITLLEFTMITAPRQAASLMISKTQRQENATPEDLLRERQGVYRDAQAAGDVTKINQLEATTVDNKPGIIEDVERSNGGRGRTVKVIDGQIIFELSLIVSDKNNFVNYQPDFEHILKTLIITDSGI